MIYSSLLFIYGFLPVSAAVYCITPNRHREKSLFALSVIFCAMLSMYFLLFMLMYTLLNYTAALLSEKYRGKKLERIPFFSGAVLDILLILIFRAEAFTSLRERFNILSAFYPFGISFMTLSAIGYLADVNKGRIRAEKSFMKLGLFFIFFPKLLMGPVMHYKKFRILINSRKVSMENIGAGLSVFVKGLAKKVIFADSLLMLCNAVDSIAYSELSVVTAWLGAIAYPIALYCTLSGVSEMGVGTAMCFGIKMPTSFNYPVLSTRLNYFSMRWFIQVKRWFSSYIIKPLYDISSGLFYRGVIYVFVCGMIGYWYRCNINGIFYGFLFAAFVLLERFIRSPKPTDITGTVYTSLITLILLVIFKGENITGSVSYIYAMFGGNRTLIDTVSIYLLRNYLLVLLLGLYISTDFFRNMVVRSGIKAVRRIYVLLTPVLSLGLLIICTALISYNGASDALMLRL